VEAFVSADELAVMHGGRIAQRGGPESVYRCPADLEVARLTGPVLVLDAVLEEAGAVTRLGRLRGAGGMGQARVMIRPEQVVLSSEGVPARVSSVAFRGDHVLVVAEAGGIEVPLRLSAADGLAPGAGIRLGVRGECVLLTRAPAHSLPR
jgi:iron(III) transport system ATP-binding protein